MKSNEPFNLPKTSPVASIGSRLSEKIFETEKNPKLFEFWRQNFGVNSAAAAESAIEEKVSRSISSEQRSEN